MSAPGWLVSRPIAHRGLHDRAAGVIENSLSAARAAVAGNFAIECDVQLSRDGEAMVFHDFALDRLTDTQGRVDASNAEALANIGLRGGDGEVIPTLAVLFAEIAGQVPLIVEIKSEFTGGMRLAERTARLAGAYAGPVALKSFDPQIMTHLRVNRAALGIAHVPLGVVAEAHYEHEEWAFLNADEKRALSAFLHWQDTRPEFLSWGVNDLPHSTPHLLRSGLGIPVMTWTVRTAAQRENARRWADQVIFEGSGGNVPQTVTGANA